VTARQRKQLSLKTRLSLLTLAIFLLGVWSVTLYATYRLQHDMLELLGRQQLSTVTTVASQLEHELSTRLQALDSFAEAAPRQLMGKPNHLQAIVQTNTHLLSMFNGGIRVVDLDGHPLASVPDTPGAREPDSTMDASLLAAMRQGRTATGKPVAHPTSGTPLVAMAAPVFDFSGEPQGAVVGTIDLDKASFISQVTGSRLGMTGGYLVMAPLHDLMVTATDRSRNLTPLPRRGVNLNHDRFMSGYEGYGVAVNSRGVEELAAARRIASTDWLLVGVWPTTELLAPIRATRQRVMIAATVVSALAGLLAWLFVRRMLRRQFAPMLAATHAVSGMAQPAGSQLQLLPRAHDDEVGQLIDSFNELIGSVQRNEAALKQDIDRREQVEATLRETETRFRKVFEQMPLPTGLLASDGRIVALNSRFVQLFGYTLDDIPDFDAWKRQAYPDTAYGDKAVADWLAATERAHATGGDIELPAYKISCKNGSVRDILISGITLSDLTLTTFVDITDRLQKQAALDRQLQYTEMMRQLSVSLINLPMQHLDNAIHDALSQVGRFFGVDRAYVFDYDLAAGTASNTHEWCSTGTEPQIHQLQGLPIEGMSEWVAQHTRGQAVIIPSVSELPPGTEREMLAPQGIQSLLTLPVMAHGSCLGFVGIDAVQNHVRFGDAERQLLAVFAELLANLAERKRTEAALRLAANVFTHSNEGITITDRHGDIVDVNAAFTRITGYPRDEVLGKNPRILNSGRQDAAFYAGMWQSLHEHGHWQGEIWNRHKNGNVFAELLTISTIRDEAGQVQNHIALFSDITALKTHQTQLEHLAHYDALTDLPNRLLLADRLHQAMNQALRRGQHIAVVYLDLDGFKAVNDTHGHQVGDQLLKALAMNMKQVLRDGDTLARLGGDEFVAVLVDLPDAALSQPVFDRLLEAAGQPAHIDHIPLRVTASLGIAFFPQADDIDADQLLRQADQAMYLAKQSGKNRYHVFDSEQDRHLRGRHESLSHIRHALAHGEFVLHYQPKVNMRTGEVVGVEALIRWQHPERGLLPPGAFLPVIEDHPLAIDLGEWVIDTALAQIEIWHQAGLNLPVSVNVGASQLQHPPFLERLRAMLAKHPGVKPDELELEVLETSALADMTSVTQLMHACRQMGVGFALDDFGTGYSSLTYLKQLPTRLLKVDQSFVRDMLDDPEDLAILEGVLGLATAFRRQVIAEGVETLAHGELLLRLGCEWGQGYAIARPMPTLEIPQWVALWQTPPAWQGITPTRREHLPVIFAAVEHRAWVAALVHHLSGQRDAPPEAQMHPCPFGRWLDESGRALLQAAGNAQAVDALHNNIHELAEGLLEAQRQGDTQAVQAGLLELHPLRDRLLDQLKLLW